MHFDSALNINGAGVGILFIMPTKDKLRYVLWIHFLASNNAAEYEACLNGLRIAVELGVKRLMVYEDSALVINELNKDWSYSSEKMDAYCAKIIKLEGKFYGIEYHHVVRDQNQLADHLSKLGSSHATILLGVFVQDLPAPSIKEDKEVEEVPPAEQLVLVVPSPIANWREQFIKYLTSAEVPADKTETKRLVHRSKLYVLMDDSLMRKSAKERILQKCITQEEGVKLLLEIHSSSALYVMGGRLRFLGHVCYSYMCTGSALDVMDYGLAKAIGISSRPTGQMLIELRIIASDDNL
ncbi:uncharacterized protein [Miscanthus floridulus]|uniref:uncharacterized protein n=1 Tax=Miscanthus floridulus TaxID=154761 RepID=UPI003457A55B